MQKAHKILTYAAAVLLLVAFGICLAGVMVGGAQASRDMQADLDEGFARRTAAAYITARLQRADMRDGIAVGEIGGIPALILRERVEGEEFVTCLYAHAGYLTELYAPAGAKLSPSAGEAIVPLEAFTPSLDAGGISCVLQSGADVTTLSVALRCAGEVRHG